MTVRRASALSRRLPGVFIEQHLIDHLKEGLHEPRGFALGETGDMRVSQYLLAVDRQLAQP